MDDKKKIAVYVDGFNLYHGLKNLRKPHLKWLNLRKLVEHFIDPLTEQIEKVYYFSAIATHLDKESCSRHRVYIEALEQVGVEFVAGNFKNKELRYKNKQLDLTWHKHEEKETDVNLAIHIIRDALHKTFDKAILITNDTDLVPAIKMARLENKRLYFKVLTPPTFKTHDAIKDAIHPGRAGHILEKHIEFSLLPEIITKPNKKVIVIPESYKAENCKKKNNSEKNSKVNSPLNLVKETSVDVV